MERMKWLGACIVCILLGGALWGDDLPVGTVTAVAQCDPATDPECNLPPDEGGGEEGTPEEPQPTDPRAERPADRDGDGVLDADDDCPDTFGLKPDGCPLGDDNPTGGYGEDAGVASALTGQVAVNRELGDAALRQACLSINEVLWTGTGFSSRHQYVELYNRCGDAISLDGVEMRLFDTQLDEIDSTVDLTGAVPARGYFLIVNNNLTLSDIQPDLVAAFTLAQSAMALVLADHAGVQFSTANVGPESAEGWFAGSRMRDGTTFSMERNADASTGADVPENWHTNDGQTRFGLDAIGNPVNGTPGRANSPTPRRSEVQ